MTILARPQADRRGELALVEPDDAAWDAFVTGHPSGNLLQGAAWSELKGRFGWERRRVAVSDARGELLAGAQVLLRRRYGLSVAYAPRGPLLSGEPAADRLLLAGMERLARRARAVFLRLEPDILENDPRADAVHTWLQLQGLRPAETIQPRSSVHVDLRRTPEAILAGCTKGHRADIRRAERQGVAVRDGGPEDTPTFHAIMRATGERASFAVHSADYYRAALALHLPRARLLIAALDGRPVAAHMVFADAHCGRYLYSGADEAGLKSGANHLLEWHAITWARELGCERYDLWGVPDALGRAAGATDEAEREALAAEAQKDPLIGVYRFKKGFGGEVVRYLPAYDQVLIPPLYGLALGRIG